MGANNSTPTLLCAHEGGECKLPQNPINNVIYTDGVNSHFRDVSSSVNSISCSNAVFGDPAPGKTKYCLVRPSPVSNIQITNGVPNGFTHCSNEGGQCTVQTPSNIIYGSGSKYTSGVAAAGSSVNCNNETFSDPTPGIVKSCYARPLDYIDPVNPTNNSDVKPHCPTANTNASVPQKQEVTSQQQTFNPQQNYPQMQPGYPQMPQQNYPYNISPNVGIVPPVNINQNQIGIPIPSGPSPFSRNTQSSYVVLPGTPGSRNMFFGYDGYDIPGYNMPGMPTSASSEQACAQQCLDNKDCQFYSYAPNGQLCYLKKLEPNATGITARFYLSNFPNHG